MDPEVKKYEIAYLINPDIPEEDVFGEAGKITAAVQEARGLVGRIEEPKKRKLAYPLDKFRNAYFGWTRFTVSPGGLAEIDKKLRQEKNVIRHLITEEIKHPAAEFKPRSERRMPRAAAHPLEEVKPFIPAAPKEEDKTKIEELDKRLEEILGK